MVGGKKENTHVNNEKLMEIFSKIDGGGQKE